MSDKNTYTQRVARYRQHSGNIHKQQVFLVLLLFVFAFGVSLIADVNFAVHSRLAQVAATTQAQNKSCEQADVTIGFGGLGTALVPQLSNGVYGPTKATPGGKYFGCAAIACAGAVPRAVTYIQQQVKAANGRPITIDIIGHSAGADGSVHLARKLAGMPNVYVRRIVAADATAFAGSVPPGVGHVINLNSSWASKSPLQGSSPIQYVNRGDHNHLSIDDLIPENLKCVQNTNTCATGKEEACKNKCSTTYTSVATGGTPQVTDCYGKEQDKAEKAIEELAQCVAQNTKDAKTPDEITALFNEKKPELEKRICIENKKAEAIDSENTKEDTVLVPKKCETQLQAVLDIRKGEGAESNATSSDASQCAWKGAVVCFPDTQDNSKLVCKKKSEAGKDSASPIAPGADTTNCVLSNRNNPQAIEACLRAANTTPVPPGTTGITGSPFGGTSPQSPTSQAFSDTQSCDEGYVRKTRSDGQVTCEKKNDDVKDTSTTTARDTKPACLLIASKEKINNGETVTLRWRTANAESLTISNLDDSSLNGQKSVTPTETTTYTLTATGKTAGSVQTCSTTISVDEERNTGGPVGSAPPRLSCSPGMIEKGESAQVKWQCPDSASSSKASSLSTSGKPADTVTVYPPYNTEYTISCLNDEGTELGKDSCAVTVGEPKYDIIVHPEVAGRGDRVRVSWASLFMKSCRVQGPRAFGYDRTQGVVITEPFSLDQDTVPNSNIRAAIYSIECESDFGGVFSKDVTVRFEK